MTARMVDPMNSLESFQKVLAAGEIAPDRGRVHSDLLVLLDQPNGVSRFTYALIKHRSVVAVAIFVLVDPINGSPCFGAAYAVDLGHRSRGYGKEVVKKAFDELSQGFQRSGVPQLYVEAIVSIDNEHSNKLARGLFSPTPKACTDSVSGLPAFQYIRQLF